MLAGLVWDIGRPGNHCSGNLGLLVRARGLGGRGQGELHTSCSVPTGEGAGSSVPWRGVLGGACWTAGNRWFHLLIVTLL